MAKHKKVLKEGEHRKISKGRLMIKGCRFIWYQKKKSLTVIL